MKTLVLAGGLGSGLLSLPSGEPEHQCGMLERADDERPVDQQGSPVVDGDVGHLVAGRPPGSRVKVAVLALLLLLVLVSRGLWLPLIGRFLVVADPLGPADAVVPLAGGDERVPYAANLFREGFADWFIATNMPLKAPGLRATYGELVRQEAIWQGVPGDRILVMPGEVETTYQEALAVRRMIEERGLRSLIVVTDPFHTRRSRMAFRAAFSDSGVMLIVRPVNESTYDPDSWWRTRDGLRDTWTEYLKLLLHIVGYK